MRGRGRAQGSQDCLLEGRKGNESGPLSPRSLTRFQRSPPVSSRGGQGPEGGVGLSAGLTGKPRGRTAGARAGGRVGSGSGGGAERALGTARLAACDCGSERVASPLL